MSSNIKLTEKGTYITYATTREKANISFLPYYWVSTVATTIGILMVAVLNFLTPLGSIQEFILGPDGIVTWEEIYSFLLPRLIIVLSVAYLSGVYMFQLLLAPIAKCLNRYKAGEEPDENMLDAARRRVLDLHIMYIPLNLMVWVCISGMIGLSAYLSDVTDMKTAAILSIRASIVGIIASARASQEMDLISRKRLVPFFFPDGQISRLAGISKFSVDKRITLVNRLGAIIPLTILLVTLLTVQWDIEAYPISAEAYGKNIILFTFVLFLYVFFSSKHLNRALKITIRRPLNDLLRVLQNVQKQDFTDKVKVVSNDEIGYAGEVVNEMTKGLAEREKMQQSLNLAREIQQNLLPQKKPDIPGFDIIGTSVYCDETGGDYYDYILIPTDSGVRIRMVLGDVSGHGISSALLMTTARALFRQRATMGGDLAEVISDVNSQLCDDVRESGNFMTLFGVEMESRSKSLNWVRAGHDPAILYEAGKDQFSELKGKGLALGVDEAYQYSENKLFDLSSGDILTLFTDGIWEAKNFSGQQFGKENLQQIIRENAGESSRTILKKIMGAHKVFQKDRPVQDDATLIVIKVK